MNKVFQGSEGNRSMSDNGDYVSFVQKAISDFETFKNFKRHPHYTHILEHVSKDHGESFLNEIKKDSPLFYQNLKIFKFNDTVGNAEIHDYDGVSISSSTLRYVKVASDLNKYFGKNIGKKIAEIGVGYGGQCLIVDKIFDIEDYHLFDLDSVLKLNEKYLECFVMKSSYKTFTLNRHTGDQEYDLVISNYAFSELPRHIQKKYIQKVLLKSKKGYLTMNTGSDENGSYGLTLSELKNLLPKFEILQEVPLTGPNNYLIVWGI